MLFCLYDALVTLRITKHLQSYVILHHKLTAVLRLIYQMLAHSLTSSPFIQQYHQKHGWHCFKCLEYKYAIKTTQIVKQDTILVSNILSPFHAFFLDCMIAYIDCQFNIFEIGRQTPTANEKEEKTS